MVPMSWVATSVRLRDCFQRGVVPQLTGTDRDCLLRLFDQVQANIHRCVRCLCCPAELSAPHADVWPPWVWSAPAWTTCQPCGAVGCGSSHTSSGTSRTLPWQPRGGTTPWMPSTTATTTELPHAHGTSTLPRLPCHPGCQRQHRCHSRLTWANTAAATATATARVASMLTQRRLPATAPPVPVALAVMVAATAVMAPAAAAATALARPGGLSPTHWRLGTGR